MQQLSGVDTLFVSGESEHMPMHIGALLIYRSATQQYFQRVQKVFRQRLCQSPIFTRKLQEPPFKLDNPYWVPAPDFLLSNHLQRISITKGSDADALEALVAELHGAGLDMTRPLWEAWVIDGLHHLDGYAKGDYGLYFKVHHSAIDGVSGAEIIAALNDIEPVKPPRSVAAGEIDNSRNNRAKMMGNSMLHSMLRPGHLIKAWRQMRKVPPAPDTFNETPMHWTKSVLNKPVTSGRVIETVQFPFEKIRKIRGLLPSTTVNHVALAIVGGAMRHYLFARGELPQFSLGAAIPMSLRRSGDATGGNLIGAMLSSLCTDIADPLKRLEMVRDSATSARGRSEAISREVVEELAAGLPRQATELGLGLFQRISKRPGGMPLPVHTIISNVPGPPCSLYLGGDEMLDLRVYGLILEPIGIFHTIVSYVDTVSLSVLACPASLQDSRFYKECLQKSFAEYVAFSTA